MRLVMEADSKKSSDKDAKIGELVEKSSEQDVKISDLEAKIVDFEATITQLTLDVATKEGEVAKSRDTLATKGKQFDHLRAAVLAAAKAVTGPPATTTTKAE